MCSKSSFIYIILQNIYILCGTDLLLKNNIFILYIEMMAVENIIIWIINNI